VKSETEVRSSLRKWIVEHAKKPANDLSDETKILEEGIVSSLDIVELVLFIESQRGEEVDTEDIDPEVFTSVNTLYAAFFRAA
jgi:acyl carrier protein